MFLQLYILFAFSLLAVQALAQAIPPIVNTTWLSAHLRDPDLVVLFVDAGAKFYSNEHIPGARHLDFPKLTVDRGEVFTEIPDVARIDSVLSEVGVSNDSRVVVHANSVTLAARIFMTLEYAGMRGRVAVLDGGCLAWKSEGRALTQEISAYKQTTFRSQIDEAVVANAEWVKLHMNDPTLALLDVRTFAEYNGPSNDGLPRGGHIPGSKFFPWQNLVVDGSVGPLLPVAALKKKFKSAGATPEKTVVTYCTVGMRASAMYWMARVAGQNVRIYDGSMSEWARKPELPLVSVPGR